MAGDSEVAFKAAMVDLGLGKMHDSFVKKGWSTYINFAFSTSDPKGADPAAFEAQVIKALLGDKAAEGPDAALIPRLRRLYAQSYIWASKVMTDEADPKIDEKIVMHSSDRAARTEAVRRKMAPLTIKGPTMPANGLVDRFATMLVKDVVRYVPWEKCITRDQEVMEEPEVKGLRLSKDGFLMQDVMPDTKTELSGEFLWDYALRRRALAGDIAGLISYEAMDM